MKNKIIILIIIIASPLIQAFGQCTTNSEANAANGPGINCPKPDIPPDILQPDPVPQDRQQENGTTIGCAGGDPFLEIEKYNLCTGEELVLTMPDGHYNKLSIDGTEVNTTMPFTFKSDVAGTFNFSYELDNGPNCKVQGQICFTVVEGMFGCTDPEACNYNPEANKDDDTCDYGDLDCPEPCNPIYGCTDPNACNYDDTANCDNGSCDYGITDCPEPCNAILGCTDPEASNYDPDANCDDGSCVPNPTDWPDGDVSVYVVCDETKEYYNVMITANGEGFDDGYLVFDNQTGINFGPVTNPTITLPQRPVGPGYSYTVSSISNPECEVTFEETFVDCTPTAIALVFFDGSVEEKGNLLKWQTASESNVKNFIIEKSKNGIDFEAMEKVKANGNSNANRLYEQIDDESNAGIYYYRLLEETLHGKINNVSEVIRLERKGVDSDEILIFPNPASDRIAIQFNNDVNANTRLKVIGSTGQIMRERDLTINEQERGLVQLNVWDFPAGIYYIGLNQGGVEMQGKFVKY